MRDSSGCTQRYENPVRCPICLGFWDFTTDELGRLISLHPVTKCVAPTPIFEPEQEDSNIGGICDECGKEFTPKKHARGSQIVCGSDCRKKRRERQYQESQERIRQRRAA